ncbi:hypothetical protein DESUT3_38720 [Desulfuromonas versatilis]|uniref:Uncharacterized protein n=1 Tax=Desulfuromonas versatilis TaxID=2802975 RepID=A0ABM8HXQ1_9BACT|nr:hypothetical protein DESUT3_38720 [Desulfuromonas versatilis]
MACLTPRVAQRVTRHINATRATTAANPAANLLPIELEIISGTSLSGGIDRRQKKNAPISASETDASGLVAPGLALYGNPAVRVRGPVALRHPITRVLPFSD